MSNPDHQSEHGSSSDREPSRPHSEQGPDSLPFSGDQPRFAETDRNDGAEAVGNNSKMRQPSSSSKSTSRHAIPQRLPPVAPPPPQPAPEPTPERPDSLSWEAFKKTRLGESLFGEKTKIRLGIVGTGLVVGLIMRLVLPPLTDPSLEKPEIIVEEGREFDYEDFGEFEAARLNQQQ